ncbi:hypothetical protein [Nocardia sp. NPDC003979]
MLAGVASERLHNELSDRLEFRSVAVGGVHGQSRHVELNRHEIVEGLGAGADVGEQGAVVVGLSVGMAFAVTSRLTKSATAVGYLAMATSAADGRLREAALTSAGRSMLDQAHRWQEGIFAQLTTGWSDKKRGDFQRTMTDLMDRSYAMDA